MFGASRSLPSNYFFKKRREPFLKMEISNMIRDILLSISRLISYTFGEWLNFD